ncbi:MAG: dinitrogenase iron-molybdenum cofactor biosynthesis protein [Treponema sp.]|nr:dinitrogenase iron-molybdenum cofactor biosynthesis protein [Treponema sp.]
MADEFSKYRIAIASSDGETVNQHFGKAEKFYIYFVDDDEGYDLVEERKAASVCGGQMHIEPEMEAKVSLFSDCRYIVVSKIGAGANRHLAVNGITALELPGSIDDAVTKVWKYNRILALTGANKKLFEV